MTPVSSRPIVRALLLLTALFLAVRMAGQDRVVFWNVENLFDCQDDTLRDDAEFLPDGARHWTLGRYWHKLDNIARTLAAIGENEEWPLLVGLAEVENDTVMRDLTCRSPLRLAGYRYVMTDSPDQRGIDVALMYQPNRFTVQRVWSERIPSDQYGLRATRDILCVQGTRTPSLDTMTVMVVHFPSRASGTHGADQNRLLAARTLRETVERVGGKVLVMGDFNAEPRDPIFRELGSCLTSLMPQRRRSLRRAIGTYVYKGIWGFLDHALVSRELLPDVAPEAQVIRFPFLLNEKGYPWRTYQGPLYLGGFSDHLPITVLFTH